MKKRTILLLIGFGFFLFGCSSKNPPLQDAKDAKMAILDAKSADAKTYAPKMFKNSEEKYKQMQELMKKEKFVEAKHAAQKAYIQAKLANLLSKNAKTQKQVDALEGEINVIKKDFATISKDEKWDLRLN